MECTWSTWSNTFSAPESQDATSPAQPAFAADIGGQRGVDAVGQPLPGHDLNYDSSLSSSEGIVLTGGGITVTVSAVAEGAIEGEAAMYQIASAYETHFAFSRFDAPITQPAARHSSRPDAITTAAALSDSSEDDESAR